MSGPGSTDYEHDTGPYVQETSVRSDYPPGLIVLSTRKSLKLESSDSVHSLGFLRKSHDMTFPFSNRLGSEVPEAVVALVGRAEVQAG
jgi:hypothetical protein